MNKKIIILLVVIFIILAALVVWYVTKPDSTNTNNQNVNSTNVPSNTNVAGIPQSEEYIFVFGLDPSSASAAGGTEVTVRGSGFVEGLKVYFGEKEATQVRIVDQKSLTVTVPSGEGTVNVKIVNPDGRSGILYDGFVYNSGV